MAEFDYEKLMLVDMDTVKKDAMEWIAERQAQKRYSKPVDAVFLTKSGSYSYEASKKIYELMNSQKMLKEIFYKLEEQLSYNGGQIEDAHGAILIDDDGSEPVITLATEIYSADIYKNSADQLQVIVERLVSDKHTYAVLETRNKDEIIREFGELSDGKFSVVSEDNLDGLPKDIVDQLNSFDLGTTIHKGNYTPFVYAKNNPKAVSDKAHVTEELNDLVILAQKKRDDIMFSSVKVASTGLKSKSKDKSKEGAGASAEAAKNYRRMAATAVMVADKTSLEGAGKVVIANSIPNTSTYDTAIRTTMNTILKKTGGATDVDSKGTVQQSKGELLMSQGDDYKVSNWKKTDRQDMLKELFTKIWKCYTEILKVTKPFKDVATVHAFISQEEVLSEREQLENAKLAKDLGITSDLLIKARYNNMSIVEMYEYQNADFDRVGSDE